MNMLTETLKLIAASSMTPQQIADKSNVKKRWIYYVINGEIKNPSVTRLQRVHDFLLSVSIEEKTAA